MYKTVRHGENSLQYTILPQTEEVLNNSGIRGKGRDYSPSIHVKRSRTRSKGSYAIIVTFGIIVTVTIAAVPICVMNGVMSSRTLLNYRDTEGTGPLTPMARELIKVRRKELKNDIETPVAKETKPVSSTTTSSPAPSSTSTTTTTTATTSEPTTPPWAMPAIRFWKSSTSGPKLEVSSEDSPFIGTPSGGIQMLDHYISLTPWDSEAMMHPSGEPDISTLAGLEYFGHAKSEPIPPGVPTEEVVTEISLVGDVLIATKTTLVPIYDKVEPKKKGEESSSLKDLKEVLLSVDDDDDMKESLEVEEFPLPPMKPGPAEPDDVQVARAGGWYGARWPFVDTTSYFQWTDYSPSDNLLLTLLVGALTSISLVLLLALAVRRRRRTQIATTHIRKLTSDLQPDDNTNLLSAGADDGGGEA